MALALAVNTQSGFDSGTLCMPQIRMHSIDECINHWISDPKTILAHQNLIECQTNKEGGLEISEIRLAGSPKSVICLNLKTEIPLLVRNELSNRPSFYHQEELRYFDIPGKAALSWWRPGRERLDWFLITEEGTLVKYSLSYRDIVPPSIDPLYLLYCFRQSLNSLANLGTFPGNPPSIPKDMPQKRTGLTARYQGSIHNVSSHMITIDLDGENKSTKFIGAGAQLRQILLCNDDNEARDEWNKCVELLIIQLKPYIENTNAHLQDSYNLFRRQLDPEIEPLLKGSLKQTLELYNDLVLIGDEDRKPRAMACIAFPAFHSLLLEYTNTDSTGDPAYVIPYSVLKAEGAANALAKNFKVSAETIYEFRNATEIVDEKILAQWMVLKDSGKVSHVGLQANRPDHISLEQFLSLAGQLEQHHKIEMGTLLRNLPKDWIGAVTKIGKQWESKAAQWDPFSFDLTQSWVDRLVLVFTERVLRYAITESSPLLEIQNALRLQKFAEKYFLHGNNALYLLQSALQLRKDYNFFPFTARDISWTPLFSDTVKAPNGLSCRCISSEQELVEIREKLRNCAIHRLIDLMGDSSGVIVEGSRPEEIALLEVVDYRELRKHSTARAFIPKRQFSVGDFAGIEDREPTEEENVAAQWLVWQLSAEYLQPRDRSLTEPEIYRLVTNSTLKARHLVQHETDYAFRLFQRWLSPSFCNWSPQDFIRDIERRVMAESND